jgi:hypothetical protein
MAGLFLSCFVKFLISRSCHDSEDAKFPQAFLIFIGGIPSAPLVSLSSGKNNSNFLLKETNS